MFTRTTTNTNSNKAVRRVLAGALAGSALAAGAAMASAAPADAAPTNGTSIDASSVGAHIGANVGARGATVTVRRDIPNLPLFNQPAVGPAEASPAIPGSRWFGACWTEGQLIIDAGVTNDKWVRVTDFGTRWFWAGGLRGNKTGGVPNHC